MTPVMDDLPGSNVAVRQKRPRPVRGPSWRFLFPLANRHILGLRCARTEVREWSKSLC